MKYVYISISNENVESFVPHASEGEVLTEYGLREFSPAKSGVMRLVSASRGRKATLVSDAPVSPGLLCVRKRAMVLLTELVAGTAEFLPARCNEHELWIGHGLVSADVLDLEGTVGRRIEGTHKFLWIDKYSFDEGASSPDVFCLPNLSAVLFFWTERAVARWTEAGLTGLRFVKIWEAGQDIEMPPFWKS